ncbi:MAG TPA: hypothetical protein VKR60_02175 [Candidatus Sulfotelmatobacter sp.]|nr:hypothetical protein [Candidatus Sulfotelmatobacter sp.]
MPNHSRDRLLSLLEAAKSQFSPRTSSELKKLISQLSQAKFRDPASLIRFHEALLFFRAFPPGPSLIPKLEKLLNTFHERVDDVRRLGVDMATFDDFDTSGIAGTVMQDALNFDAVRWLARRIPRNIEIAWDDYLDDSANERSLGSFWPRIIPLLAEDSDVEANIPWTRWLDSARGRERPLEWLLRRFEQLTVEDDPAVSDGTGARSKKKISTAKERKYEHDRQDRVRARLYDALRLPVRWKLENLPLSRTRNWQRARAFFYHREPLITRGQVSLARELSRPAPRLTGLSLSEGQSVMHFIREVMAVRYRELYGTTLGDPASVVRADLAFDSPRSDNSRSDKPGSADDARGVVIHLWNLPPARRLPLRAYVAGFTLKNGVPINYIEAIGLCEWIEVGFNTFYTYRQGETAWIYAQALRCLCAFTGATTISVYPYQIGQNNDEAIDSGAFWFYRKLGFRSGRPDLEQLARREEQKIAANSTYRTPPRILRRLAEAHVFYDRPDANPSARATVEERPFKGRVQRPIKATGFSPRGDKPGPWDTFSTRNLALRVNRRMAREFDGDSQRLRHASVAAVSRALGVNPSRWSPAERQSLENWSLVLALIPDLAPWSPHEKQDTVEIILSQADANEMHYLHLTQRHPRLRAELLRLGSNV